MIFFCFLWFMKLSGLEPFILVKQLRFFVCSFVYLIVCHRDLLYRPGWLETGDPSASASWMQGLQACTRHSLLTGLFN
jgi:hypothetical protein